MTDRASRASKWVERVRSDSIVHPLLWLTAIVFLVGLPTAVFTQDPVLKYALLALAILTVFASIGAYIFFAVTDPQKLQPSDHQLKVQALDIISKGGAVIVDAVAVRSAGNPELEALGFDNEGS